MSRIDEIRVREDELALILAKRELLENKPGGCQIPRIAHLGERDRQAEVDEITWKSRLFGLAFSGGGIRSATFNLGILQSLAKHKLLRRIDYLSTVSGGGYIGGWFTTLLQREHYRLGMEGPLRSGRGNEKHAMDVVEKRIHPDFAEKNKCHNSEDPAITHLRSYSNYLTPKLGFFSGDTWALLTTYLRNVLLMQTILVSFIVALLLVPRIPSYLVAERSLNFPSGIIVMSILGLVAAWFVGRNLAAVADTDPAKPNPYGTSGVLMGVLGPVIVMTFLMSTWLKDNISQVPQIFAWLPENMTAWAEFMSLTTFVVAVYFVLWLVAAVSSGRAFVSGWVPVDSWSEWASRWLRIVISGAAAAVVLSAGILGTAKLIGEFEPSYLIALWAPPLILLSVLLTETLHIGLAASAFKSQQREWLSRLGAWALIISVGWLAFATIALVGPFLVTKAFHYNFGELLTAGWVGTTVAGLIAARGRKEAATAGWIRKSLIVIAPYVFIAGMVVLLSAAVHFVLGLAGGTRSASLYWPFFLNELATTSQPVPVIFGIAAFVILALVLSNLFDINEFSLHNMYQNRLTRCYLGATTECRYANPFTGFSMQDDIPLWVSKTKKNGKDAYELGLSEQELKELSLKGHELAEKSQGLAAAYPGPYPLINTAINLVGGERLAWQERKAASFLLSPLYCGFQLSGRAEGDGRCKCERAEDRQQCNFCIRRFLADIEAVGEATDEFLERKCPFSSRTIKECIEENHELYEPQGSTKHDYYKSTKCFASEPVPTLTLGDAIATSGAAASPNMGYHTTPALAFLLSIFNIRLGRWIGNPLESAWRNSGPTFALYYLLNEVFGLTNKKSRFVYLSDGGHFDNLGIYELVRRRCRYIIACDASADPGYRFEDLANATRKCRIDFGVNIDIDVSEIKRQDKTHANAANCALGKIRYPDGETGKLLYIKASRLADLPADVTQYAMEHAAFPHQITVDQFFSESQFESYRRLGLHIGDHCLADSVEQSGSDKEISIPTLFRSLSQRWYKRSTAIETNFTRHADTLRSLFQRLETTPELAFIDEQFYPEWRVLAQTGADQHVPSPIRQHRKQVPQALPDSPEQFRAGFYFCNSLIQLAENVYVDLNLEDEHNHPDNSGWMNLFRHWASSGMFRVTWAISASTYGPRFRSFCERRLDLKMHDIVVRQLSSRECEAVFRSPDDQPSAPVTLNLLERRQLAHILADYAGSRCDVYQLDMAVRGPSALECTDSEGVLLTFNFGYAVVVGGDRLVMFRVQDHMRRMGLGGRALQMLFEHHRNLRFDSHGCAEFINGPDAVRFSSMFDEIREVAMGNRGSTPNPEHGYRIAATRTLVVHVADPD